MDKVDIEFIIEGKNSRPIVYLYKRNDYVDSILRRYANEIKCNVKELSFEYNGSLIPLDSELTLGQINSEDNLIRFFVTFKEINNNINSYVKSQYIICPECKQNCLININDYKISLYNCYKDHSINNLSINEFIYTQYINESSIQCGECKLNKANSHNNEFYICSCGLNLCPLCQVNHRINKHNVFDFNKKNFWCIEHNEKFTSFCPDCKYNLCLKCELIHNINHKLIEFKDILPNKHFVYKIKGMQNKFREYLDKLEEEINKIVKTLHSFLDSLNAYFHINEEIIANYELKYRKYKKINSPGMPGRMRIFGDKFVDENYDNCYLSVNNKQFPLSTKFNYIKENDLDDILEVKLIETKKITSMNSMFKGCKTLVNIDNFSEWDTSCITDMSFLFNKCISLKNLPDLSKWKTSNVVKMNGMFDDCESLLYLPDLSKWDVSNVCDMNHMFSCCKSLKNFPDISKWNTSKVVNMNHMFSDCKNVEKLPDISKWNLSNVKDMKYMFFCFNKSV